jgi:uncharacterized protein involved in exopolysaccharide biosynthesis
VIALISDQIERPGRVAAGPAAAEMSLFLLVEPLFRHLKLFLVVAGAVFALALCWIFLTPRKYESEASILVQNARSNVLITAGNNDAPTEMRDVTEEQLNSEVEVLTSRDLKDEVVQGGWNSKPRSDYSKADWEAHEKAVESLSRRLEAIVPRRSNVMVATVTASTPEEAQEELRRLIAAFIARQRQISRPPGAAKFFAEQAERYKSQLAQAQQALAEFQNRQKLVNVNDREATLSGNLSNADSQRRDTDVQIRELEKRIEAHAALLETLPSRQTTQEHTTALTGALDQLTTQLVTLKNQRTELLNKYPPTDRAVRQIELQIVETEAGIHAASSPKSKDAATDINPTWQQLQTDMAMMRSQLSGLRARRDVLSGQIAQAQSALGVTEQLSPEFTALQHRVNELDTNYQAYLHKRDEAEVADSMDRQDLLNFAVVEAPTYSSSPVHPKPVRDIFLGLITALLLGGVAVFLMESVRDTAGAAAELERWTHFPVLATVPWTYQAELGEGPMLNLPSRTGRDEAGVELSTQTPRLAYFSGPTKTESLR